jgi:hypothetical protein
MKLHLTVLFLFSSTISLFAIDASRIGNNISSNKPKLNSAYFIRPIDIYQNANQKLFGMSFEGETAFNNVFSLKAIEDICGNTDVFHVKLLIGPQYNLFENALEGLLVGIYPGFTIEPFNETDEVKWKLMLVGEVTYNLVLTEHLGIGVYLADNLLNIADATVGIKIGIMFENSTYKVY